MQNIQTNPTKEKLLIISIFAIIIVPLSIALATTIASFFHPNPTSEKSAFTSDIPSDAIQYISKQIDLSSEDFVAHQIAQENGYLAALVIITDSKNAENSFLVILHKNNDQYSTVYSGTDFDEDSLDAKGVPEKIINKVLDDDGKAAKYQETISNALTTPADKYTLTDKLPFKTDDLIISSYIKNNVKDADGVAVPIIEITATDAAERMNALDKIRSLGYDIGYYPVIFRNFDNPFPVVNADWEKTIEEDDSEEDSDANSESTVDYNDDEEGP